MMKKRWLVLCLCGVLAGTSLTGCEKISVKQKKKTIAIAMPSQSLERWNRDGSFLKKAFENEGYQVVLNYSENSPVMQQKDLEKMVADKPDLLIVTAIDSENLAEVLKDTEIPVIAYDRLIRNTDAVSCYVSYDNYKVGELQGEYIIDTLKLGSAGKKTFNMEITEGDPADNNAVFYYNGAMDALKQYIDGGVIKIPSGQQSYAQTGITGWDTARARERMQNLLKKFYKNGEQLDIALCANDSTALGVTQALTAGYQGKSFPLVTGQDGDEENLKNILEGTQSMTVYKSLKNESLVAFRLAKKLLEGEEPKTDFCDELQDLCEVAYDTEGYDNGVFKVPSYLLMPQVVTKKNYKQILVDTGDYKEEDGYLRAVD